MPDKSVVCARIVLNQRHPVRWPVGHRVVALTQLGERARSRDGLQRRLKDQMRKATRRSSVWIKVSQTRRSVILKQFAVARFCKPNCPPIIRIVGLLCAGRVRFWIDSE